MKVIILYHPNSEHDTRVNSYVREAKRVTGHDLELVSVDTPDGANKARVYDVTRYPAVLATRDSGELLQLWQDEMLPTISEVSAYMASN